MSEGSPNPSNHTDGSSSEDRRRPNDHPRPVASERRLRLPRACTVRGRAAAAPPSPPPDRRPNAAARREREERLQCSRIVTSLVPTPPPAEETRWSLRSMWELASLLNFLHVFRPLLNVTVEFSAEELETALIAPNSTLADLHIPLLRATPPITRMALGHTTWVTVLCRKLRDWWHWVADGDLPIVASHGSEMETYMTLEPSTRVLILKAICDVRVEQDDIRSYIERCIKHGMHLSSFRGERFGGDSHGVSYWYEDDPLIGHRLYREIRQIDCKKVKGKGMPSTPVISCQWETVASNLDEFQEVSDKLFESRNPKEVSVGRKLKTNVIPEVERIHKRKERTLKKQHREALLLDSFLSADGLTAGRSLRDRKPVTYTFDDYDRSINEALKITKKRPSSAEPPTIKKESAFKPELLSNGNPNGSSPVHPNVISEAPSPKFSEESDEELKDENLDRSNRRRRRPQRYSEKEFVGVLSDNDYESYLDSDDDIVGEAVYDEEYLRSRKQRKISSSSEGDEEYSWQEENGDDEDDEDSLSISEDSDEYSRSRKRPSTRSRRGTKIKSVDQIQTSPRRSRRSTRPRINYRQYEFSDSDEDSSRLDKSGPSRGHSDASTDMEFSVPSQDSQDGEDDNMKDREPSNGVAIAIESELENGQDSSSQRVEKTSSPSLGGAVVRRTQFLDLNELAPSTGFDDGLGSPFKGEDQDDS